MHVSHIENPGKYTQPDREDSQRRRERVRIGRAYLPEEKPQVVDHQIGAINQVGWIDYRAVTAYQRCSSAALMEDEAIRDEKPRRASDRLAKCNQDVTEGIRACLPIQISQLLGGKV